MFPDIKALVLAGLAALVATHAAAIHSKKPNIIVILTDDQDTSTLNKREYLPKINQHLVDQGVLYDNFFAPVSVCCPSRVSLLRAQYAHNHNVTFVSKPWGGWEIFNNLGYHGHTVPDFVQAAGYNTYYTGKFMNDHTDRNCESLPVSGFNSSDILSGDDTYLSADPYTYDYWTPAFSRDNGPAKVHDGEYSTSLVHEKALAYIDNGLKDDRPFFLTIAPVACHSCKFSFLLVGTKLMRYTGLSHTQKLDNISDARIVADIPPGHPRHAAKFPVETIERRENWNPDFPTGVSWVKHLDKLNATHENYLDDFFRGRLRALQSVDEIVDDVVHKLEAAGELDNTYIFYTADNGYALGSHRRQPGKTLGFEEDIHVPLIARGPNIPPGYRDTLSSYGTVDLARTILDIAGAKTDYEDDGRKINLHQKGEEKVEQRVARHAISEYWVLAVDEGVFGGHLRDNNTYRTLRVHDDTNDNPFSYSYSVWCTGERELYDLVEDPSQVRNLLAPLNDIAPFAPFHSLTPSGNPVLHHTIQKLLNRLDALLLVLKRCSGETCHNPYASLFPPASHHQTGGEVWTFEQALEEKYDEYFEGLVKVRFSECALGFQEEVEKPDWRKEWAFGATAGAVGGSGLGNEVFGDGLVFQGF
ncbi:hypothetical protein B9479_005889 [Cryptococcus floricola]|uniref:Sulfatase N-terminal domain-containing protein n=1 Tax=Cryptococcus floricola TaxID=2591691 RepID=A0A5D3ATK7_9TREE|nr:hypothetical protein B9479_005889 [Cryptococcus floricola]